MSADALNHGRSMMANSTATAPRTSPGRSVSSAGWSLTSRSAHHVSATPPTRYAATPAASGAFSQPPTSMIADASAKDATEAPTIAVAQPNRSRRATATPIASPGSSAKETTTTCREQVARGLGGQQGV